MIRAPKYKSMLDRLSWVGWVGDGGQGVALVVRVVVQWRPRAVRRRPVRRQR
jgi:hypothetical protein